ncbi:MAG: DUF2207 domain-containing protein [Oscillospiraceae bacterium]|nr:DUF2207 domain-containing protein [Oscillospiraceae bacterium]
MKKLTSLVLTILLIAYLALGVSAATGASAQESFATVSSDGSCQITTTVTLHLEEPLETLQFPIPLDASGVTVNGARMSAARSGDVRYLDLSRLTRNVVGDVTVSIHYNLHDVIEATESGLQMKLPLLSGFAYPVQSLTFSVTLPGAVEVLPGFVSGYHQARIEEDLTYQLSGNTISGSSLKAMKDHETLYMTLSVTEEMFPQSIVQSQDYHWGITAMVICGALALLYWLLALWNLPLKPAATTQPPQGYHPGQMGSLLCGQGMNLTLTVLHWAQLGYLAILPRKGRVVLQKRMEMGNECAENEQRIFRKLFGGRRTVDTAESRYAQLYRECASQRIGVGELFTRFSGNSNIFRFLASGIGLFGGASLAVAMADGAVLQGLLLVVMAIAGFFSGWYLQGIGPGLLLQNSRKLKISASCAAFWLAFGALAGDINTALSMVLSLAVAGLLLCWGGRRTRQGREMLAQALGFRRYLCKKEQQSLCRLQPEHFFAMLPWAMALGCGRGFVRAVGKWRPEGCDYVAVATDRWSADQWLRLFRRLEKDMNRRADNLPLERVFGTLDALTKR